MTTCMVFVCRYGRTLCIQGPYYLVLKGSRALTIRSLEAYIGEDSAKPSSNSQGPCSAAGVLGSGIGRLLRGPGVVRRWLEALNPKM